jgi:hypothetical protein
MRLPGQVIILVFSPNRCDCSIIVPEHLANRTSMSQTIRSKAKAKAPAAAKGYLHSGTDAVSRPSIGAAPRFKTKKPPTKYRYDSSLSPALDWGHEPDAGGCVLPDGVH